MVGFRTLLSRRGEPSQRVRRLTVVASVVAVPLSLWTPMLVIRRLPYMVFAWREPEVAA